MFLYKNLFFSISSILSIPIMLIGINGGYFQAICRVCLMSFATFFSECCPSIFSSSKLMLNRIHLILLIDHQVYFSDAFFNINKIYRLCRDFCVACDFSGGIRLCSDAVKICSRSKICTGQFLSY